MTLFSQRNSILIFIATLVPLHGVARATIIEYPIGAAFSTDEFGTVPAGSPPWLKATFDDGGSSGSVTLTLENVNLFGGEYTREWDFNLDPNLTAASLSFSAPVKVGSFDDPSIGKSTNAFQADGDGLYDIQFLFAASNEGGGMHRFGPGESVTYVVTGIPTLVASSFSYLSAPAGGVGPFYTAAHIQGIAVPGGTTSAWSTTPGDWSTIPEPSAIVLALFAACAVAVTAYRNRISK